MLVDKHGDSFGPELPSEAWRGRFVSFPPSGIMFFLPLLLIVGGDWNKDYLALPDLIKVGKDFT